MQVEYEKFINFSQWYMMQETQSYYVICQLMSLTEFSRSVEVIAVTVLETTPNQYLDSMYYSQSWLHRFSVICELLFLLLIYFSA